MSEDVTTAAQALIDAIESVQDWNGTYVGDCILDLERAIGVAPTIKPEQAP